MTTNEQVSLSITRLENQIINYSLELADLKRNISSGLSRNTSYVEWLEGLLTGLDNCKFELEEIENCLLEDKRE
jgi:hypothetical protein